MRREQNEGSIYKEKRNGKATGRYIVQVHIGVDARTGRKVKRTKVTWTLKEAKDLLKELLEKYEDTTFIDADKITVREWLTKWFETYKLRKIRGNTASAHRHMIEICKKHIGDIRLEKLQRVNIQKMLYDIADGGQWRTADYVRVIICAALKRAYDDGLVKRNPATHLEMPEKPDHDEIELPSMNDWQKLLDYPASMFGWRQILLLEFVTGCRRCELLGLSWENVDIEKGTIFIAQDLIIGDNGPKTPGNRKKLPVYLAPTKTKKSKRLLNIPQFVAVELAVYKKQQLEHRLKSGHVWEHPEMVFSREGKFINPSSFSSRFSKIRKMLGIKSTFHAMRHDMATRMKAAPDFDFKDMQEQLGHSNIQTTINIYTKFDQATKKHIADWAGESLQRNIKL